MGFDEDFSRNVDVGEEEDETKSLPEPDEEGRKMAESQEVAISVLRSHLAVLW